MGALTASPGLRMRRSQDQRGETCDRTGSRIAVTRCTGVEVGAVLAGQRWGRDRLMNGHADPEGLDSR
jgi:hypothetical protein